MGVWVLLGGVVVLGTVNQMYGIDISLYVTTDAGRTPQLVGWMAGLTAAVEVPVMIAAGRVAERAGKLPLVLHGGLWGGGDDRRGGIL